MKRRWVQITLVVFLLIMIVPTAGYATENVSGDEAAFASSSNYPGLHLTHVQEVSITGAVYGSKLSKSDNIASMDQDSSPLTMLLEKEAAIAAGNIGMAKTIQSRFYERQIELQTMLDAGVGPNQPPVDKSADTKSDPQPGSFSESVSIKPVKKKKNEVSALSNNILTLGSSYDISFPQDYMAIFDFTSGQAGNYKFSTGPYGGNGASNDTVLYLYADGSLSQLIG